MKLGLYFAMANTLTLPVKRKGSMTQLLDAFTALTYLHLPFQQMAALQLCTSRRSPTSSTLLLLLIKMNLEQAEGNVRYVV